jgi:8-amino-7-oxononanoate synthase
LLDFASALYLGLRHPMRSLRPWEQFSTGVPAALATAPRQAAVEQGLAELLGCERAALAPSTVHLFWDLFAMLARHSKLAIYMDAGAYPIARWGVERAAARGVPVSAFRHNDSNALRKRLWQKRLGGLRPVIVADGFCPGCGKAAPIADYAECARQYGGWLVLDDTQALGILGDGPGPNAPYGRGGGGSLRWHHIAGPAIVTVSSLAKGFGVPVAVLAGSRATTDWFEERSETRMHCSPSSMAAIHAAEHALRVNALHGDVLRLRLAWLVRYFRQRLGQIGLAARGGLFPVQTLLPNPDLDTARLHRRLLRFGVRAVLHRARSGRGAWISFIINARHRPGDIDHAMSTLRAAHLEMNTLASRMLSRTALLSELVS